MSVETSPAVQASGLPPSWPFTLSVVIPAFNEGHENGIGHVVRDIRARLPDAEILVVDDGSTDDTAAQARSAGARVVRHPYNKGGPGAGIKTGMRHATGEVVLTMDADGQMDPRYIPQLLGMVAGGYDLAIGAREPATQASWLRRVGNGMINALGSYLVEQSVGDLTSGYRAFRRDTMRRYLHLLPNGYSWCTTSTLAFMKGGYHVGFVPVAARKRTGGISRQKLLRNGINFVLTILRMVSLFAPLRVYFPVALVMELGAVLLVVLNRLVLEPERGWYVPNSSLGLFIGGILVFMFGLLAEQIAALRQRELDDVHG